MRSSRTTEQRRQAHRRGVDAETRVCRVLESAGWTIRARNWRGGGAELDVVASRGDAVRFVEVKRRSERDATGLESIDSRKQARLIRAARAWLFVEAVATSDMAFAIAIVGDDEIHWIDAAFEA